MVKAVVFDLDGTLLNTLEDLWEACNYAIGKFGYKPITLEECRMFIGNGIKKLVERSLKGDNTYLEECFTEFSEYYYQNSNVATKKYDGIDEVLDYLISKGISVACISNKRYEVLNLLVHAHFGNKFIEIIGDGEGYLRKPSPDTLIEMGKRLNASMDEIIYVGDSDVDFKTVANAGCRGMIVSYGFRSKEDLAKAGVEITYETPYELLEELKREI